MFYFWFVYIFFMFSIVWVLFNLKCVHVAELLYVSIQRCKYKYCVHLFDYHCFPIILDFYTLDFWGGTTFHSVIMNRLFDRENFIEHNASTICKDFIKSIRLAERNSFYYGHGHMIVGCMVIWFHYNFLCIEPRCKTHTQVVYRITWNSAPFIHLSSLSRRRAYSTKMIQSISYTAVIRKMF